MACPFGFTAARNAHDCDADVESEDEGGHKQAGLDSEDDTGCDADGRFDYNKDPVSWFFQNQIKSEEEFQARKAELRAAARKRLDQIFEKKGQRLVIDSDDDEFSMCSSELSAWDSDVASISSLQSCAREWREDAHFNAPAEGTLQLGLIAGAALAAYCCWQSLQAMLAVNRFWGIIKHGWMPTASFVTSAVMMATAASCWLVMGRTRKRWMLLFQVVLQLLYVVFVGLAVVGFLLPSQLDAELKTSACSQRAAQQSDGLGSRLCQYLPAIEDEVKALVGAIVTGCGAQGAACGGLLLMTSWYLWELALVENKALKHKRRRRHRKNSIPWEKIKVENMGPVTTCGAGGGSGKCPFAAKAGAAAGTEAAVDAANTKKTN